MNPITIQTTVKIPVAQAWTLSTLPEHITKWNFANDEWHCPSATNDLRVGGKFSSRMEAKDGSFGFDFEGVYEAVIPHERIEYILEDGRKVKITFTEKDGETTITEIFDPESENSIELQQQGWQAILNNYKKYAERI
jgi:uncharacterized protein YndB with AHSA1/START domain